MNIFMRTTYNASSLTNSTIFQISSSRALLNPAHKNPVLTIPKFLTYCKHGMLNEKKWVAAFYWVGSVAIFIKFVKK